MMRWALGVEYDGAPYSGWQAQHHAPSVQAELERALSRVADHPVSVVAAGRTDAGVHALGQVVHFDSPAHRPPHSWVLGCNTQLPDTISVRWAQLVGTDFHARYTATARSYKYVLFNQRARSAVYAARSAWWSYALNAQAMHEAAQQLLGENDFSSFQAAECQSRTPMRRLDAISVQQSGSFVTVSVTANAFVHHMVRNIVGTLLQVGQGKQPPAWVGEVLAARDRNAAGMTAPAAGLYLAHVSYPDEFEIPRSDGIDALPGAGWPGPVNTI